MTSLELGHEQKPAQAATRLVAGRYRLHARIGSGRLGDIYEAHDEGYRELGVGGRVAIQLLPDRIALDQGLFSKLKLGYTVLRAGAHPNIVPYLDCDHDGKFGYVVMERLDGASLRFVLDDVSTLPLDEALPVIRAIGDALQFLHAKSMIHGQLGARSVFITENLEVRLLDVVPLDSASTILRGIASGDPFSRSDASDDVHALACLAYEVLAGRHPFNFHPPAEASAAGIQPARIASLPEPTWTALKRGMSLDRDRRPDTVQAFLDELGITGTERLRRSGTRPADDSDGTQPAQTKEASPGRPVASVVTGPVAQDGKRREIARKRRKRASRRRSLALLPVLVALATWYFYGEPHDDIANLAARLNGSNQPAPAVESAATIVAAEPGTALQMVGQPLQAPVDAPEEAPPPAVAEPAGEEIPVAVTTGVESDDRPGIETTVGAEIGSETDSAADTPGSTLIQSLVTVYERDGAARIAFRRPLGTTGTVVWWTADGSARADSDYIPLEEPVIAFASGDEAETLHIPLVNDGLPEPQETFFVFLGQRDPVTGELEPIARIRVDVNDDD